MRPHSFRFSGTSISLFLTFALSLALLLHASIATVSAQASSASSTLLPGRSITARLGTGDHRFEDGSLYKAFTFAGEAGQRIRISMRSNDFDAYLLLVDPDGNLVASDDDSLGIYDAQIEHTLTKSGHYTVYANSYWSWESGQFTLLLEVLSSPPSPGVGSHLVSGQTVRGHLGSGDPRLNDGTYYDAYTFVGEVGQRVRITLHSSDFEPFLMLGNPLGYLQEWASASAGSREARIDFVLTHTGEHEILANTTHSGATGTYTLTFEIVGAKPEPTHPRLVPGQRIEDRLERNDPQIVDGSYYKQYLFDGMEGDEVRIWMRSNTFDTFLILLSPDEDIIAYDDDSAGSGDALLTMTLPETGTYTVVATSYWGGDTGRFTLELEQERRDPYADAIVGELRSGLRTSGRIGGDTLVHYWTLQVPPGTSRVEIGLFASEGQLDLIAAPGSTPPAQLEAYPHQALTGRENERLTFTPAPGRRTYVVGVINWTDADLGYQIEVAFNRSLPPSAVYTPSLTDPASLSPMQRAIGATVQIHAGASTGSGTLLTPDGIILTDYHLIADCVMRAPFACEGGLSRQPNGEPVELIVGLSDERLGRAVQYFVARPLRWLPEYDLALIEIVSDLEGNPIGWLRLPTLPIDPSIQAIRLGEEVIAVGYAGSAPYAGRVPYTTVRGTFNGLTDAFGRGLAIRTHSTIGTGSFGGTLITATDGVLVGVVTPESASREDALRSLTARSLQVLPREWLDLLHQRGAHIVTRLPILR